MGFWKEKIIFCLFMNDRMTFTYLSVLLSYSLAILTSRKQVVKKSSYQYFKKTKLWYFTKKLIGRGTPSGKGRDHPSRRAKKILIWVIFLSLETRLRSDFLKRYRAAEIILSSTEHTLLLSDDNKFQSPKIHLAISNFCTNNSISLLTLTSVTLA